MGSISYVSPCWSCGCQAPVSAEAQSTRLLGPQHRHILCRASGFPLTFFRELSPWGWMVLEITFNMCKWQLLSPGLAALSEMQQLNGKAGASLWSSKECTDTMQTSHGWAQCFTGQVYLAPKKEWRSESETASGLMMQNKTWELFTSTAEYFLLRLNNQMGGHYIWKSISSI